MGFYARAMIWKQQNSMRKIPCFIPTVRYLGYERMEAIAVVPETVSRGRRKPSGEGERKGYFSMGCESWRPGRVESSVLRGSIGDWIRREEI